MAYDPKPVEVSRAGAGGSGLGTHSFKVRYRVLKGGFRV